jgi:hypothetical protein
MIPRRDKVEQLQIICATSLIAVAVLVVNLLRATIWLVNADEHLHAG